MTLADLVEKWVRSGRFKFDYWCIPPKDGYYAQLRPFLSRFKIDHGTNKEFFCVIKDNYVELLMGYGPKPNYKPIFKDIYASDPLFFEKLEEYMESFKDCLDGELYSPS